MAKTKWTLDPAHSELTFKVKHMMIANVTGKFDAFSVIAETENDDFTKADITFSADTTSVNTGNADRDGHLKSPDFFDAENHRNITFVVKSLESKGGEDFIVTGDLSIRGISKTVKFDVEYGGIMKDPWGNEKAGFTVSGKINRKDFGLEWNTVLESGGVLVGDEVKVSAEIQLSKAS